MALLDAGVYRAQSKQAALGETKGGKEQVIVKFSLLDFPGTNLTWYGFFTEKTTENTLKSLRLAGWKGADLSDLSDLSRDDAPEVHLVVEQEQGQDGVVRNKVRWVNATDGVAIKSVLAPDKAKSFAARMKGKVVAFDKANGSGAATVAAGAKVATKRAPAQAQVVPQDVIDAQESENVSDDIPF